MKFQKVLVHFSYYSISNLNSFCLLAVIFVNTVNVSRRFRQIELENTYARVVTLKTKKKLSKTFHKAFVFYSAYNYVQSEYCLR